MPPWVTKKNVKTGGLNHIQLIHIFWTISLIDMKLIQTCALMSFGVYYFSHAQACLKMNKLITPWKYFFLYNLARIHPILMKLDTVTQQLMLNMCTKCWACLGMPAWIITVNLKIPIYWDALFLFHASDSPEYMQMHWERPYEFRPKAERKASGWEGAQGLLVNKYNNNCFVFLYLKYCPQSV